MKRLLLYVHFNKWKSISNHVLYQLEQMRPLFSKIVFISNSELSEKDKEKLESKHLFDNLIERKNKGFDFAAWRDGMVHIGTEEIKNYDSVTLMNDTCFGPLWDMQKVYQRFENDSSVDFWGMTNFRQTKQFQEHIQSYYMSFSKRVVVSSAFQTFWQNVRDFTYVQDVIDHYESNITTTLVAAGFKYRTVFDTVNEDTEGMLHPDFSYYNPTAILKHKAPFIKVKTIVANQGIAPYLFDEIECKTSYPVDLIISHMSKIDMPDLPYLLGRKYLSMVQQKDQLDLKIAVHLHVFYVDLLQEFLESFKSFDFDYDLFITTDNQEKLSEIKKILTQNHQESQVFVTGNVGRDVLPMLKLKQYLSQYDYVGHFHTKKSKEADFWAGQSWRTELIDMLVKPANHIIQNFHRKDDLGLVIADIPTFFRYNRIVVAWNEGVIAPKMNELWKKMNLSKDIDFTKFNTFVMSYGTFIWFKYDALKPLFDLELTDNDVPEEPLPQNSILHAIERLLIYIAWNENYDFRISQNLNYLTPFIDNKQLNNREDLQPHTFVDFNQIGGVTGAIKYIFVGPARAIKYIVKRIIDK
ncbi:rhamnan synthesis F family protein [Streptococcus constellatus subsp. pharyngis]|uniref:Lipopolysaccharide biosynthesis protein n=2 Tax=Streptococcus constellatus subsp. pharyngis SK1060 = CCUG 46377 TaxID=1035184 RepID=U2ZF50_STRCV|nr:rhamnan synthesis F family protein [Streptococcus constellatus]AGU72967.1 putative rhamnan synthesis protein F [Streptococcus constellatus subsp. pharyngis C232]AGU74722.1 putative rhamnan synthesis protein F [Streptococcus constellatus subsp. pharyngis C818]AGU80126.1 putative rhamnan synthesis protein F [Streptococcus constellatus subsp. pharyngis C1050]QRP82374.1 alpha-L-Rha alpha-1,3-L-rhamnosyltransferase [Streptococcus constellatus]GAD43964.1 lipopolysaccharide biosynthesis protein [S